MKIARMMPQDVVRGLPLLPRMLLSAKEPSTLKGRPPRKAFDSAREGQSRPATRRENSSSRLVPPPPPPGQPSVKEKRKPFQTVDEKYGDRRDCVIVKNIPSCYNVVNHLTKYFSR
jgi:hypothetical protein